MGFRVMCPYCREWHSHGLNPATERRLSGRVRYHGRRVPHCDAPEQREYLLHEWPCFDGNLIGRVPDSEVPIYRATEFVSDPADVPILEQIEAFDREWDMLFDQCFPEFAV